MKTEIEKVLHVRLSRKPGRVLLSKISDAVLNASACRYVVHAPPRVQAAMRRDAACWQLARRLAA